MPGNDYLCLGFWKFGGKVPKHIITGGFPRIRTCIHGGKMLMRERIENHSCHFFFQRSEPSSDPAVMQRRAGESAFIRDSRETYFSIQQIYWL